MTCAIEIKLSKKKSIIVSCLYRHPNTDARFYTHFESLLMKMDASNSDCIIIGDFNIDYTKLNDTASSAHRINTLATDYGMRQSVEE
jgi:exonuclease III